MRQLDPFRCVEVWNQATPFIKKLLCAGAGLDKSIADKAFEELKNDDILALASAAGRLEWQCSEFQAIAPIRNEYERPRPAVAFPPITLT